MNRLTKTVSLIALAVAPLFASASGFTTEGSVNAGGFLNYAPSTNNGTDLRFEFHGGYYYSDAQLLGLALAYTDNEYITSYQAAALYQWHFFDNWFVDENGQSSAFSPFVGVLLGVAHGANSRDSATGLMAGLRVGLDVFLTQRTAISLKCDFKACTGETFMDDRKLTKSDTAFGIGLDFFF